jgi:hypothetical protein
MNLPPHFSGPPRGLRVVSLESATSSVESIKYIAFHIGIRNHDINIGFHNGVGIAGVLNEPIFPTSLYRIRP